ncbi:MAG: DUF2157 domain-containing protein [Candidatus Pacebacteria bacterium]|nr:DUF2157 domain-containing protein [Candidatus Paceibacterota bacterium]
MRKTKEELLKEVREMRGELTKEELLSALKEEKPAKDPKPAFSGQQLLSAVSYSIGALIVLTGVSLLVWEFWDVMGSAFRIGVTFGMGVLLFAFIAILEGLSRGPAIMKEPLAILSGLLVFFGSFVVVNEVASMDTTPMFFLIISSMLAVMFATLNAFRKSSVYMFFITASATGAFYSAISTEVVMNSLASVMSKPVAVFAYLTSLIGLSYLFLAKTIERRYLTSLLYFLGAGMIVIPFFFLADLYSTSFWSIIAYLALAGVGLFAFRFRLGAVLLGGFVSLIGAVASGFYGIFVPLIVFAVFSFFGRRKDEGKFSYLLLIAIALTAIPYAVISLNFINETMMGLKSEITPYALLTSLIGLTYIASGWLYREKLEIFKSFSRLLYFFGSFALIVSFFFLADIYTGVWDVIAFLFIVAIISLGVYLSEKIFIFSGAFLLVVNIITVSYRHFVDSIGWPIALILIGFLTVGVGYFSYFLSRKIKE